MTAVEFFDRSPLENIISAITTRPDKIVFIGDGRVMDRWAGVYREFLKGRGLDTELEFADIRGKSIDGIVEVLSSIVELGDPCVFEVTGGSEPALVAMGIVYDRYREKDIQMQYFRVRGNRVIDADRDGAIVLEETPKLTVREVIGIHGGVASFDAYGSSDGRFSEGFAKDVEDMWEICRQSPKIWNFHASVIGAITNMSTLQGLAVSVGTERLRSHLNGSESRERELDGLLTAFESKGLIRDYGFDGKRISFKFKSAQIKKCLTKAGSVLELIVLLRAMELESSSGKPYFTDGLSGVCIDWDGALGKNGPHDTENEIDVILMHGVTPVFISCKNGHIDDGELYKLNTVAGRFGGEYARRVLVCTETGRGVNNMAYLRQRARDMNIHLIENVHKKDRREFEKLLRELI